MTTYSWTGTASTDFGNAANWIVNETGVPDGSAPGALDTIDLAGTGIITGTGTVAALDVLDSTGGGFVLSATVTATSVSVLGDLNLAFGGQLSATTINVGGASTFGFLDVTAGTLAAIGGALALTVSDGAGSSAPAQLTAGTGTQGGASLIALGNGVAQIGIGAGQAGGLNLANATVTGGASSRIVVGQDGAAGTITLLAATAAIQTHGSLILGDSGTGSANLMNGGTLTLGNGSGAVLVLGAQDGGLATPSQGILQSAGATITANGQMQVGEAGQGIATLSGGSLATFGGLVLGDAQHAQGTLTLAGTAWTDTGTVMVGNSGSGTLQIGANGQAATAYIHGALLVGAGSGAGALSLLAGSTLTLRGETILGASPADSIAVSGGATWNSATHLVALADAQPAAQGSTLSVTGTGSLLQAGVLSVGRGDLAEALSGAAIQLGASAAGTAGTISGGLIVDTGSTLSASGNVAVTGAAAGHGLLLLGGDASFTATAGPALTLVQAALASIQGSSATLTATGGLRAIQGSTISVTGGTLSATATSGLALQLSNGASLQLNGGLLATTGGLSLDDGHGTPGTLGGTLTVNGGTLTSDRGTSGRPAVFIGTRGAGTSIAQIQGATWTVTGGVEVGTLGNGELLLQHADLLVSRGLYIGGGGHALVTADTVVTGGTLTAFETGISAATLSLAGTSSLLETGSLRVGGTLADPSLTLAGGTLSVTGVASVTGELAMSGGILAAGTISVAAGAVIGGTGSLTATTIADQGRIGALGGTLTITGALTGSGQLGVRAGTLILTGAETQAVTFGNAGTIVTPSLADLAGTISGWQPQDAIDFAGAQITAFTVAGTTLSLFDSANHLIGTETFSGPVSSTNFTLSSDHATGTLLSYHA
jgi:T5SS/PEP-CTERM-associated repeat protein